MKKFNLKIVIASVILTLLVLLAACGKKETLVKNETPMDQQDSLIAKVMKLKETIVTESTKIKVSDEDLVSYGFAEWTRFHQNHASNIKVNWPDGQQTIGREELVDKTSAMLVFAPDTKFIRHPLQLGSANKTAITGTLTGTFTKPMLLAKGKIIEPNGRSFSVPVTAIGVWDKGLLTEEFLIWDHKSYLSQLGVR